jgi:hypothetical protein
MTIGIGVLCSTMPRPHVPRPDAIVLLADAVDPPDMDAVDELHKAYVYPEEGLIAVCVGNVERADGLLRSVQEEFRQLQERNPRSCTEALEKAVHGHRIQHFQADVLSPGDAPSPQDPQLVEAWHLYDVGVHVIVGTFDDNGLALMYLVARIDNLGKRLHRVSSPGFATIGLEAHSANYWLYHRRQVSGRSVRQSAYHAYEAARLITGPRSAGGSLEMIVATKERAFRLTDKERELEGCPVSLLDLEKMFERYGPRDTDQDLGHPRPLASSSEKAKRAKAPAG